MELKILSDDYELAGQDNMFSEEFFVGESLRSRRIIIVTLDENSYYSRIGGPDISVYCVCVTLSIESRSTGDYALNDLRERYFPTLDEALECYGAEVQNAKCGRIEFGCGSAVPAGTIE